MAGRIEVGHVVRLHASLADQRFAHTQSPRGRGAGGKVSVTQTFWSAPGIKYGEFNVAPRCMCNRRAVFSHLRTASSNT
eukprot:scaffold76662_cov48-Phaeocystis_antarctica.AAC.2